MDDFWNKIEKRAAEVNAWQDQQRNQQIDNQTFVQDEMPALLAVARRYEMRLQASGIRTDIFSTSESLGFRLKWEDGEGIMLSVDRDPDTGALRIQEEQSLYSRHAYAPALHYRQGWEIRRFEERLEDFIDTFMEGAIEHGGF